MGNSQRYPQNNVKMFYFPDPTPPNQWVWRSSLRWQQYPGAMSKCPYLSTPVKFPIITSSERGHLSSQGSREGWTSAPQPCLPLSEAASAVILLRKCLIQSFLFCKSKSQVTASDWWSPSHMPALNCKRGWESEWLISASGMQKSQGR